MYAKAHQDEDQRLNAYYESVTSGVKYARWTRTQVHRLNSNCPLVVNILEVHPGGYDIDIKKEPDITPVSWLPKTSGYIQELDEQTGLPKRVGPTPNENFNGAYYRVDPDLEVAAAIRNWISGLSLNLDWEPSVEGDRLGVRLAKNFGVNLERTL